MDPMGLPMYHPRMPMMGQFGIGSMSGSIPINASGNLVQEAMRMQRAPVNDSHMTSNTEKFPASSGSLVQENMRMQGAPMNVSHFSSNQNRDVNKMPLQKEVDEEGRKPSVSQTETMGHLPTERSNADDPEEVSKEKIKTVDEQLSADNFVTMHHDLFLKISDKKMSLKDAAEFLDRPYRFVYKRYLKFCKINGIVNKKKKGKGKRKRKTKPAVAYQCQDCPAIFNSNARLMTHSKLHLECNESHLCTECGIVFPTINQMMSHRIKAHGDALQCPHCEKQFTEVKYYNSHIKLHFATKNHVCDECGRAFHEKYALEVHYRTHTGIKPFMCGYCEKTFTTVSKLKEHTYVHTGGAPKKHECPECGKRYQKRRDLEEHMHSHTGARPYECDQCDATFAVRANLQLHKDRHAGIKKYQCTYCPAAFHSTTDLQRHDRAHTGVKPFKCDLCDYSCAMKRALKLHRYTHTGEKPYKCDHYGCNAEYARPTALKKHKLIHTGPPPPRSCKMCNEKFNDVKSFRLHMMLHRGEKPLECDQCDEVFYSEPTLSRHMTVHMYKPDKPQRPKIKRNRKKKEKTSLIPSGFKSENLYGKWFSEYQANLEHSNLSNH